MRKCFKYFELIQQNVQGFQINKPKTFPLFQNVFVMMKVIVSKQRKISQTNFDQQISSIFTPKISKTDESLMTEMRKKQHLNATTA